jgi:hypothetical protein
MLAVGDLRAARDAAGELTEIAGGYGTPALRAMADHARGAVLLVDGDAQAALVALRAAWQAWRELQAPHEPVERFMYGWSVLHCLPATMAERPVEATGTVLRTSTVARWAAAAGFGRFEVLPIDNPFWRFYRLRSSGALKSAAPR